MTPRTFQCHLLTWFDAHGRKDLPWQRSGDPYRVWISEVMLQQTQVTTVIPYFERFTARFPDVRALADAALDEVMALWSGLGYYARARNLHRAARRVRDEWDGCIPESREALASLPGIGPSTAGAILALSRGQRHPILDGNVKRVLARFHRVDGWPGRTDVSRRLWQLADHYTPGRRVADYTQAIMDLGALLCVRRAPACGDCPVANGCLAHRDRVVASYPAARPRRAVPTRRTAVAMVVNGDGAVLLERRPPAGIWGGLWSFPECDDGDVTGLVRRRFGVEATEVRRWSVLVHTFSHFRLEITPVVVHATGDDYKVMDSGEALWYNARTDADRGLAAPVRRLLDLLGTASGHPGGA